MRLEAQQSVRLTRNTAEHERAIKLSKRLDHALLAHAKAYRAYNVASAVMGQRSAWSDSEMYARRLVLKLLLELQELADRTQIAYMSDSLTLPELNESAGALPKVSVDSLRVELSRSI